MGGNALLLVENNYIIMKIKFLKTYNAHLLVSFFIIVILSNLNGQLRPSAVDLSPEEHIYYFKDPVNRFTYKVVRKRLGMSEEKIDAKGSPRIEFRYFLQLDEGKNIQVEGDEFIGVHSGVAVTAEFSWKNRETILRSYEIDNSTAVKLLNTVKFPVPVLTISNLGNGHLLFSNDSFDITYELAIYNFKLVPVVKYLPFENGIKELVGSGNEEQTTLITRSLEGEDTLLLSTFDLAGKLKKEIVLEGDLSGFVPSNIFIQDSSLLLYGPKNFQEMQFRIINPENGKLSSKLTTNYGYNKYANNQPLIKGNVLFNSISKRGNPVYHLGVEGINLKTGERIWQYSFDFSDVKPILTNNNIKASPFKTYKPVHKNGLTAIIAGHAISNRQNEIQGTEVEAIYIFEHDTGELKAKIPVGKHFLFPSLEFNGDSISIFSNTKRLSYEIPEN